MEQSLDNKLASGYMYRNTPIPNEKVNLITGIGGAKLMIDALRKEGLPDDYIATLIQVKTDDYGWVALSDLTVKKLEK